MKATLYELSESLRDILAQLDTDGEIPADLEAALDAAAGDFAAKIDGVLRARVNYNAQADGIDVEIKRLTALRDGFARRADWLREYVFRAMLATGQKNLQTKLFKLWVQKNGRPSVSLADGADIPAAFTKVVTTTTFDGQAAYDRWKAWRVAADAAEAFAADDWSEPAEAARMQAAALALPATVRVIEGSHLRVK